MEDRLERETDLYPRRLAIRWIQKYQANTINLRAYVLMEKRGTPTLWQPSMTSNIATFQCTVLYIGD